MTDERAAVLAAATAYFVGPEAYSDDLKCGPLREWSLLRGEPPWSRRYRYTHTLESVEISDLDEARAVIDVRGEIQAVPEHGSHHFEHRVDGRRPREGRRAWLIAGFTLDGRRRLPHCFAAGSPSRRTKASAPRHGPLAGNVRPPLVV